MSKPYQTIERASHGATYQNSPDTWTVYEISRYPRSSVLAGQQRRRWMDDFDSLEAAKAAYPNAKEIGGSTYREPSLAHLPDESDSF